MTDFETGAPPLDPEIAAALAALPVDIGALFGSLSEVTLPAIRQAMSQTPVQALSDQVERVDHKVPDGEGIVVRVHRPTGTSGLRPCIYWMHGGGMVLGDRTQDDGRFDSWCPKYECIGASVEYRLAPEFPFPAPLEDCYTGLAWIHENASELGIDRSRVGIGGTSAGGGLAAGLALLARDRGEYPIAFQMLVYPMIDDRQLTPSSRWPDPVWPPSANTYGWSAYLGAARGGRDVSIYAAPARARDLRGLPTTLIAVGANDGFSDEDIDLAVRLGHARVPVELHVYPGAPHGFDSLLTDATIVVRARRDMDEWLSARLR
jgi:acetyl esterase/lipase